MNRHLALLFFSALLAACSAEHASPGLVTFTPAPPDRAQANLLTPWASATLPASPSPGLSRAATPGPRSLAWCANGLLTCFDSSHTFPLTRPVPIRIDPTYRYASTQGGALELHRGVEFLRSSGAPVFAAAEGQVLFAGDDAREKAALRLNFYGNYIILKHAGHIYSLYAHLSSIQVERGQFVGLGEQIGQVGASGAATGSHLHFEVRAGQNDYASTRNPELWFAPLEGAGALAGRLYDPAGGQPRGAIHIQRMEGGTIGAGPQPLPIDIYPPELMTANGENFALTDLPAGEYRLTYLYNGKLYEYFVTIRPQTLTLITIVLD